MNEANISESSYEEGSSEEIVVELGQANRELIGASVTDRVISGSFGVAEVFRSKSDRLLLLDPQDHTLKIITKVYRGILVKSTKKKQSKNNELKSQQPNPEENDAQANSSQNLFDSSVSSHEQPTKKRRKRQDNSGRPELTGKTRIIRKIRTLSKKQQEEGIQK